MDDVLRFGSRKRIAAEASEWLSRLDRGLTDSEMQQLEMWLAMDRRHPEILLEMAALWDDMEILRELSDLFPLPAARDRRTPRMRWLAGGATLSTAMVLMAISVQLFLPANDGDPGSPVVADRALSGDAGGILATAVGQHRVEALPDGSVIQLNTDSLVEVFYSASERRVALRRGEAHFEVQHDAVRPFVVQAGGRSVEAVGTAFNVYLREDSRLEVLVTEGRVLISRPKSRNGLDSGRSPPLVEILALTAGELAMLEPSQHQIRPVDIEERSSRLAWQRRMLSFNGESLEAVLQEVERYTDIRFRILDQELTHIRIGGVYKTGDVRGLLRSLEQNFSLRITHDEEQRTVELQRL